MMNAWEKIANNAQNNGEGQEVAYTSFPEGTTVIRILEDEPFSRYTHWIAQANSGKGISVDCIGDNCPICEEIRKARANKLKEMPYRKTATHAINIYNKTTDQHELLDKGNGIFANLASIQSSLTQQGMSLKDIDISVSKTGKKLGDIKYTIIPSFAPDARNPLPESKIPKELFNIRDRELLSREQIIGLMGGKSLADVLELPPVEPILDIVLED